MMINWKLLSLLLLSGIAAIGAYMIYGSQRSVPLTSESPTPEVIESVSPSASPQPSTTVKPKPTKPSMIKTHIITAKGTIELELYPDVAPKTVANFVKLAKEGFYNGTKFHRVIPEFMIQGGDPLSKTDDPRVGTGGPGYRFEDEINPRSLGLPQSAIGKLENAGYTYNYNLTSLPVTVGAIAMANSGPNTNGSQFFIVTIEDQPHLNGRHTVFGKVAKGMDVVTQIRQNEVIQEIRVLQ